MKKILVTGGTVFVSRAIAEYFLAKGCEVYVLNRNTRPQPAGAALIEADRHSLGGLLRGLQFDLVVDTAYTARDVAALLDALGSYDAYVLISSSAVYPESAPQPFREETPLGPNRWWGSYGADKIGAEQCLRERAPAAYLLRPPYLYGPGNNVYREAFVFDCALAGRKFYLPRGGEMQLQFFYIDDLCRFIDLVWEKRPNRHVFNVGSRDTVSVRSWVELCYRAAGRAAEFVSVWGEAEQRNYFSFYDYEYILDVSKQAELMPDTTPLATGLRQALAWYKNNPGMVTQKPYWNYIDTVLAR